MKFDTHNLVPSGNSCFLSCIRRCKICFCLRNPKLILREKRKTLRCNHRVVINFTLSTGRTKSTTVNVQIQKETSRISTNTEKMTSCETLLIWLMKVSPVRTLTPALEINQYKTHHPCQESRIPH